MFLDGSVPHCISWFPTKPIFIVQKSHSSRPEVFCQKDVLRNFAKFTGKHLRKSLFFDKVAGFRLKKETLVQVLSCEFCEILKNTFFYRTPLVAASERTSFYGTPKCLLDVLHILNDSKFK